MAIRHPYLMFLGDAPDQLAAKTAAGVVHWRRAWCMGQLRLPGCQAALGLPDMTIAAAQAAGCRTLVVGVANRGGVVPEGWSDTLCAALAAGMDVASGLHERVADIPAVAAAAVRDGQVLHEVRHPTRTFDVGSGAPRPGKRLLTVGTDCSVGKMYTSLALHQALEARGVAADFRATGQTGILIAGEGVSVDAVVADFISGATEWLSPANDPAHWDVIEGQGSLHHPSFAGVTMGLVHGAQPDALVLCHEPTRQHMRGLPDQPLPDLRTCIDDHVRAARLTNPQARCVGVAVNTAALSDDRAREGLLQQTADELGLPCVDPVVTGVDALVDAL